MPRGQVLHGRGGGQRRGEASGGWASEPAGVCAQFVLHSRIWRDPRGVGDEDPPPEAGEMTQTGFRRLLIYVFVTYFIKICVSTSSSVKR